MEAKGSHGGTGYSPSLYRCSPFGALIYTHPKDALHEAQCKSATVCVPVLSTSGRNRGRYIELIPVKVI